MPYYIYAIHTDHTNNRLYGKYTNYSDAETKEQEMHLVNYPGDNYFVRLIHSEDDVVAEKKADEMRPFPKIAEKK